MTAPPKNIRANSDEAALVIYWNDGASFRIPYQFLRGRCPCAGCVDEMTGSRVVDVDRIPDTIQLTNLATSGNYALKIVWNDGHDTGLYTWEYLAELCRTDQVQMLDDDKR